MAAPTGTTTGTSAERDGPACARPPSARRRARRWPWPARSLDEIEVFDLYSCFASAVEIGCQEIGLAEDDPRGLTITGGLPFFGGPGNNYVTHSISEMMRRLRARPGAFGLVTANGNYVTKHSFGVYSTDAAGRPVAARDVRRVLQAQTRRAAEGAVHRNAAGRGHDRDLHRDARQDGPEFAVVFGRLNATGQRFIANLPETRRGCGICRIATASAGRGRCTQVERPQHLHTALSGFTRDQETTRCTQASTPPSTPTGRPSSWPAPARR